MWYLDTSAFDVFLFTNTCKGVQVLIRPFEPEGMTGREELKKVTECGIGSRCFSFLIHNCWRLSSTRACYCHFFLIYIMSSRGSKRWEMARAVRAWHLWFWERVEGILFVCGSEDLSVICTLCQVSDPAGSWCCCTLLLVFLLWAWSRASPVPQMESWAEPCAVSAPLLTEAPG